MSQITGTALLLQSWLSHTLSIKNSARIPSPSAQKCLSPKCQNLRKSYQITQSWLNPSLDLLLKRWSWISLLHKIVASKLEFDFWEGSAKVIHIYGHYGAGGFHCMHIILTNIGSKCKVVFAQNKVSFNEQLFCCSSLPTESKQSLTIL